MKRKLKEAKITDILGNPVGTKYTTKEDKKRYRDEENVLSKIFTGHYPNS